MTYKKANLEVVEFHVEDVIATSSGVTIPNEPVYTDTPDEMPNSGVTED